MHVVSQVFALIAAAVHVSVWPLESFLYERRPWVRVFLTGSTADAPEVRLWRFNVGFYNLFLALGMIAGFVALRLGHETVGRTLIVYLAAFMVAGGITLVVSAPKLWRGGLGQAVPGVVILLTELLRNS
ncbi:DUF1304 domain-containing protein [Streptomyces sp. ISL-36]|uniref:DUF1304 domain-containing protein n=1 Tax=Streptomyces sp. ISL-36 TaxID=2819182 RepID=UPI001BEB257E|nr:DUF1304 domain-containing protein [Streptomyces sp. ISL-36]MBT2438748.1 DUF1304 domain-containing protein [Streptomyces sp. ISL-36]